jgi:hypothetical protein
MPTISPEEITQLNALFDSAVRAAIEIKGKDSKFKAQCEQIERGGQEAKTLLREILGRPD